jgi:hypothetical protein
MWNDALSDGADLNLGLSILYAEASLLLGFFCTFLHKT